MTSQSSETARLAPGDEAQLAAAVIAAAEGRTPLAIIGGGTHGGLGRPMQTAATLSTARLTGVTLYEPQELVLSARAGTPVAEVERLLAANGQRLAFEPPDHRAFYAATGEPTIGGIAAANLSGPRRITAGAARDSLIGLRAVNGRGEAVKSGGRVMKNVTGLDLVKFLAGSHGTLSVLSELTFKVQPAPEIEATLVLRGLDDPRAIAALCAAVGSPWGVTGAAHRPEAGGKAAETFIRIDGFAASVDDRMQKLRRALAAYGEAERIDGPASAAIWRQVRDLDLLAAAPGDSVWRISVKPSDGPGVAAAICNALDGRLLFDWAGGLVWIATGARGDAGAGAVRAAVKAVGGHATLFRAPADIRNAVEVFEPLDAPLMALTRKLKESFDPAGVLNPGRMYSGV